MRFNIVAVPVMLVLILSVSVYAAIPPMINYQGKLLQASGAPVADGTYQMQFAIYDVPTGGTALWSETNLSVQVKYGLFATLLGSINNLPANIFDNQNRWFGVKVGSDPEMTPRQQVASSAFAFRAAVAGTVDNDAITADKLVDGAVTGAKIADGAVTAGKLADHSVSTAKIENGAVGTSQIQANAITGTQIANGAIASGKLVDGAIGTNQIANGAVTLSKTTNVLGCLSTGKKVSYGTGWTSSGSGTQSYTTVNTGLSNVENVQVTTGNRDWPCQADLPVSGGTITIRANALGIPFYWMAIGT